MKVIIIISGFTQKTYQKTGSRHLWRKIHLLDDLCAESDVLIDLKEWDSDWSYYAKFINSLNPESVFIACYSWGGGFGMPELAKDLECDVSVVACDPVFRSKTPFARWMAFADKKIKLSDNVSIIGWVGQRDSWYKLDGDTFEGGKYICEQEVLDYSHTEIDNSPEYHKLAVLKAKEYLQS